MKLKTWRNKHKLNLIKLSNLLGVSTSEISRWENGQRFPRPAQLKKIKALTRSVVNPEDFI